MAEITKASENHGLTQEGTAERLISLIKKFSLPAEDSAPVQDYLSGVMLDKKRAGSNINLVLLRGIGDSFVHPLPVNELAKFLGVEAGK